MDAKVKLTPNQLSVLYALRSVRQHDYGRELEIGGATIKGWAQPREFGGRDGSHHSSTATALAKKGLVDRYKYGSGVVNGLNNFKSRAKGACWYRITDAGLEAIKRATGT